MARARRAAALGNFVLEDDALVPIRERPDPVLIDAAFCREEADDLKAPFRRRGEPTWDHCHLLASRESVSDHGTSILQS